jgi:hypothetical protein
MSPDPYRLVGPFSIFRNTEEINTLYNQSSKWVEFTWQKDLLQDPVYHHFDEFGMSDLVCAIHC